MEWFTNIWAWIVAHKDAIVVFFTSSSFVSLVAAIIGLIRQHKAIKANTATGTELTAALDKARQLTATVEKLKSENAILNNKVTDLGDSADRTLEKVNAMLEVQSIVYGYSIKDEKTRIAVANILTNAKYNETATRAALIAKIEEMEQSAASMQDEIGKTARSVKKTLTAEEKPEVLIRG